MRKCGKQEALSGVLSGVYIAAGVERSPALVGHCRKLLGSEKLQGM
jgi:hypothetical protein